VVNPPKRFPVPLPPPRGRLTVMVGKGLSVNPPSGVPRHLTINPGSAAFGVPRGSVRHLDRLSKTMERTSRPVVVSSAPPVPSAPPPTSFGASSLTRPGMATSGQTHHSTTPPAPSRPH
jgi:hypothetical protein